MEKKTILTLDQVKEIEKTYPTPFHIYDEKGIRENAKAEGSICMEPGIPGVFCGKGNAEPVHS